MGGMNQIIESLREKNAQYYQEDSSESDSRDDYEGGDDKNKKKQASPVSKKKTIKRQPSAGTTPSKEGSNKSLNKRARNLIPMNYAEEPSLDVEKIDKVIEEMKMDSQFD